MSRAGAAFRRAVVAVPVAGPNADTAGSHGPDAREEMLPPPRRHCTAWSFERMRHDQLRRTPHFVRWESDESNQPEEASIPTVEPDPTPPAPEVLAGAASPRGVHREDLVPTERPSSGPRAVSRQRATAHSGAAGTEE